MLKMTQIDRIAAVVGSVLLIASSVANAQIEGAVQYPPISVGEDAQPPPPARMAPRSVSPRRIELGASGSSQVPANNLYRIRSRLDVDGFIQPGAPLLRSSPTPASPASGD